MSSYLRDTTLVSEAGLDLAGGEPELVRRLGLFLTFFGRYPVPRPKDAPKLVHGSIMTAPMRYTTNDVNLVDALYARMHDALKQVVTDTAT